MSTIKRWADKGYLGPVYDEREKFPALSLGSGKQRNVYERSIVLKFLFERRYIRPIFEVLDLVRIKTCPDSPAGTIIRSHLGAAGFEYSVQREDNNKIFEDVAEDQLESIP